MPSHTHTTTRPSVAPTTQHPTRPGAAIDTAWWHWRNARPATKTLLATPWAFLATWVATSLNTALIAMTLTAIGALAATLATPRTPAWARRQAADIPATIAALRG